MNTAMWEHPVTAEHLRKIGEEWGIINKGWFDVLRPVEKELACGDTGSGAMKDWREIVEFVEGMMDLELRVADGSKGSGG
jgi:phosphopantothenoylcysteine decarboxylase